MKRKKTVKFKLLCIMLGVIPMLISALSVGIYSTTSLETKMKEGVQDELKVAAAQVREYFAYDVEANGAVDYEEYADHEYIESLQDYDIELTLFQDKTRVLTSIKDANGDYVEGTDASDEIYASVKAGNDYSAENVDIQGTDYFVYYMPIYDGNGEFWGMAFAGEKMTNATEPVSAVGNRMLIIIGSLVVIFILIVLFLAIEFTKALKSTEASLQSLAGGNLSTSFRTVGLVREFNEIGEAGRKLSEVLVDIIGKTKDISGQLRDGAMNVSKLSTTSKEGADSISSAMNDLADGASAMASSVQNINEQVVEMGFAIDDISNNTERLVELSGGIKSANSEAADYIGRVASSSQQSVVAVNDIAGQIQDTNSAVENIKRAVEMISSIASQTNLLALNASIEAARAGEAGKGFAVVADEIKTLAEQTNTSTTEINQIVSAIVDKSHRSVELSGEVAGVITKQQEYIRETQDKFEVLNHQIIQSEEEIDSISTKVVSLNQAKNVITESVGDLSAISQENAASNEEVSASISGIADAIGDIADSSQVTNESSDMLDQTVNYFR